MKNKLIKMFTLFALFVGLTAMANSAAANSLVVGTSYTQTAGVVAVPISITGNTNAVSAVTAKIQYDKTKVSVTAADVSLSADTSAAGWTVTAAITPPTVGSNIEELQINLFKSPVALISTPSIALAKVNFTVLSTAANIPLTLVTGSTVYLGAGNTVAAPSYTNVNGSITIGMAPVVDTTPPIAPTISTPTTGSTSNNNTPTVSGVAGSAEASSTVKVYDTNGTTVLGTTTASAGGSWTLTSLVLADGAHTLTAKATDAANNTSPASTGVVVTIDTTAPAAPAISQPTTGALTNNPILTVSGSSEANATVKVYDTNGTTLLGTTTASGAGAWTLTSATLAVGAHTLTAKATDAVGNTSAASTGVVVTIDTIAPAAPTISTPTSGVLVNTTASVAISGAAGSAEAGATVTVKDVAATLGTTTAAGNGSWTLASGTLAAGAHSFTATQTDVAGNTGAASAAVTYTVDTTAPVITLTGGNMTVAQGGTFTDPGYSASDNVDGNITANVVVTGGPVNTAAAVGTVFTLKHNVSDAAGNPAAQKSRTVTITAAPDATPPVITLTGGNITIAQGAAFTDPGYAASDNVDGNITANVVVTGGPVNTNAAVGTVVTLNYNVSDAAGNAAAQKTRTVTITATADTTAPVIVLTGGNITVAQGGAFTEPGYTATDNPGAVNLTGSVVVTGGPVNTGAAVGTVFTLKYNVSDAAGNAAVQKSRTVTITDGVAPVITMTGGNITVAQGAAFTDPGYAASDNVDGNITANVVVTGGPVNTGAAVGTVFTLKYNVSDAAGNAAVQKTRTVTITDGVAPVITMTGGNTTVVQGQTYTDAGATAADTVDGNLSGSITVNNAVNASVIGVYSVTYDVSDAAGNAATRVTRTVTVVADTPPTITLIGATPITIVQGATYNDGGASAVDDVDGNVTASIITVNLVDTAVVATYTVTYNVSDAAGNAATQVTRTVNVIPAGGAANRGEAVQVPMNGSAASVEITSAGEVISSFSSAATSGAPPAGVTTPFGVLSYTTTVPTGSTTQTVNLSFSSALPAGFDIYKVDNAGVYTLIPNGSGADQWTQLDASTIALTLTDGGQFDLDGMVNGVIVDPVAVGSGSGISLPFSVSAGGCVIVAANKDMAVDPLMPTLALLSLLWLVITRKRRHSSISGVVR